MEKKSSVSAPKQVRNYNFFFLDQEDDLLAGTFDADLISFCNYYDYLKEIKKKTVVKVYVRIKVSKREQRL
ncbi:MAG: hypothetical protein AAGF83_17720 [Cyanobacteria bacterium P01_G01_bin.67]